ncbi:MAG: gluconate 2-dehydrogenase subunit 3 family protein [Proteobacteria bacterium]|nr:gluconate 2-dehydrogenase subunit 3 family protein [Pseudomonadota bacterium]
MSIRKERPPYNERSDWRKEIISLLNDVRSKTIDRRTFLTHVSAVLAITATLPLSVRSESREKSNKTANNNSLFIEESWQTLSVVHDHLFPTSSDTPGAKQINATSYLQGMLAEPDMDSDNRKFILNGVGWLNDIAHKRQKSAFIDLNEEQREDVLRQIEKTSAGERWISLLLLYIFEALLSDPVYGGNPDQIGWRWLEHQPGFPRPPASQTYQKL